MARKPKKTNDQDAPIEGLWDHFGLDDPRPEPKQVKQAASDPKDDPAAAMEARLARMEADLAAARQTNMALMAAPMHSTGQQSYQVDPKALKIDLAGMPDPYEKPAEYAAEHSRRTMAVIEAREYALRQELATQNDQTRSKEAMWNGFASKYPQWTEFPEVVGTVAERLVKQKQAQGIDPQRYMFVAQSQFYDDIAGELNKTYGALIKDEDDPTQDKDDDRAAPKNQRREQNIDQDGIRGGYVPHGAALEFEDDGRTSVFGGQESGGKPSGTRQAATRPGMIEDLSEWQRKSGFF